MTVTTTAKSGPPRTLMEAHDELVRIRPCRTASLSVWQAYYQQSVAVYEQIAKTDPAHEYEARYWAQREQAQAKRIEAQIRAPHSTRVAELDTSAVDT